VSLPWLIKAAKVPGDDAEADHAQLEELVATMSAAASASSTSFQARGAYPVEVLDLVRRRFDARPVPAEGSDPGPELGRLREQYQDVSLRTMAASRRELLRARASGAYSTRVLKRVERHLDLTEGSMEQLAQLDV
jgi:CPA1 family monovalent cation:H+ antiporter